jgi:recombination associated protein RdgC
MLFKSLSVYRINFSLTEDQLREKLQGFPFEACRPYEESKVGWVSPYGEHSDYLNPESLGCQLISLKIETRKVPSNTLNEMVNQKIAELRQKDPESRITGGLKKQIKEDIKQELLPRAFSNFDKVFAYIDNTLKYLVINVSSKSKAESFVSALRFALDDKSFEFIPVKTTHEPTSAMTNWLVTGNVPKDIEPQETATIRDTDDASGNIKYNRQDLNDDRLKGYLGETKTVSELSLSFKNSLSFTLTENFIIKSIKWSDEVKSKADVGSDDSLEAALMADFTIMQGEIKELLKYLIDSCLGGEHIIQE